MKSLVSTGIKFCPGLLLVMPYSPSGMPRALFFRTLHLLVIFQKLLIWFLLMEPQVGAKFRRDDTHNRCHTVSVVSAATGFMIIVVVAIVTSLRER